MSKHSSSAGTCASRLRPRAPSQKLKTRSHRSPGREPPGQRLAAADADHLVAQLAQARLDALDRRLGVELRRVLRRPAHGQVFRAQVECQTDSHADSP